MVAGGRGATARRESGASSRARAALVSRTHPRARRYSTPSHTTQDEFSKLVALTAARTLLGREIREQLFGAVAELLHDLDDGMRPISVFFPYLPTSFHKKRDV